MNYNATAKEIGQATLRDGSCQSIEWYGEGQTRIVEVDGVQITIRFVGRRGRRCRIAITAPSGAVFRVGEMAEAGDRGPCDVGRTI